MSARIMHRRLSAFVEWIATESAKEDAIRDQAESIRQKIKGQANEDGLVIRSTPNSGSFAKRTGLRRHLRGASVVEGQDVDLPFVVSPKTREDETLKALLPRFLRYAEKAYPDTKREPTNSSVLLIFSSKLRYDLVPMLATSDPNRQILIRSDGERRETSVQQHVEFIRSRTRLSEKTPGRVKFNEMVRLFKWWREFRQDESAALPEVPSMLIDLLSAYAFDLHGVQDRYAQTFIEWSGAIARAVRRRSHIAFSDFMKMPPAGDDSALWTVRDPVSPDNNITAKWNDLMCDELADWYQEAHDTMCEAAASHDHDDLSQGLEDLVAVFGTPINSNCGDE